MSAAFVVVSSSGIEPSVTVPPAVTMRITSMRMLANSGGTSDARAAVSGAVVWSFLRRDRQRCIRASCLLYKP